MVTPLEADFTRTIPAGPFDGVLAANSLHFVADPLAVSGPSARSSHPAGGWS
jgi:hypothetical protein